MPRFRFTCNSCQAEKDRLISSTVTEIQCECGHMMSRQLPQNISTRVFETGDSNRGTQVEKGIQGKLRARMARHHDAYEVADKIDKHGLDDAKKFGWLKRAKKI